MAWQVLPFAALRLIVCCIMTGANPFLRQAWA